MNERTNHILYQADTPRLRSKTKKYVCYVCFLKLIVKFTSIFGLCRFKNSKAWHFLTFRSFSSKLEFVVIPCDLILWSEDHAHLLVKFDVWTSQRLLKSNPQVCHHTHLKDSCMSQLYNLVRPLNNAVEIFLQRKSWVWAANNACLKSHWTSASACLFGNNKSSHSGVRTWS